MPRRPLRFAEDRTSVPTSPEEPPPRLAPAARWLAGAGAVALLGAGVAALALAFGLLPQLEPESVAGPAAPTWALPALQLGAVLAGMGALVAAGRFGHAALSGRHPGPWGAWALAAGSGVPSDLPD